MKLQTRIIRNALRWEKVQVFSKYGCSLEGPLIVACCDDANKTHPEHGTFAAGSCFDVVAEARAVIQELGITDAKEKLSIPDLVLQVTQEQWNAFQVNEDGTLP